MSNTEQLEQRIADLEAGYKNLAYEYTDALIKRIEDIRVEVMNSLSAIEEHKDEQIAKARQELDAVIEKAKKSLSHDALVASLAEHKREILSSLIDPSTGRLRHR